SGSLVNGAGGTLNGPGSIKNAFSNPAGTIAVAGGTLNVQQAFSNAGHVALSAINANLSGGAITNTGTIDGNGTIGNDVTNTGTIEASGGTLTLNGALTNNAAGFLVASTGTKLLVNTGLANN